jgi:nucleotide-binding universal stress UspA family protein
MLAQKASVVGSSSLQANTVAGGMKINRRVKVLCATRALSRSDATVSRAHAIARDLGAQLLLLHVIDFGTPMRAVRRRGALAYSVLDASARDLGLNSEHISVRSGQPHRIIADVAMEWDADLIVIGPYRQRFAEGVRGTSAERIARRAGRPVLVVNLETTEPYQNVLLTSDLSRMSAGIAGVTKDLGLLERSKRSVVHALEHTRNAMLYMAGVKRTTVRQYHRSMRQLAESEIHVQLFSVGLDPAQFKIFAPQVHPIRAIEQIARRTGSELIVVGSSRFPDLKRLFIGSVSNEILRSGKHDVLLVSPAAAHRARRRASAVAVERVAPERSHQTAQLH